MRVTLKNINEALMQADLDLKLYRGDGYFYFNGPDADFMEEQGVYGVRLLSALSIKEWVDIALDRVLN